MILLHVLASPEDASRLRQFERVALSAGIDVIHAGDVDGDDQEYGDDIEVALRHAAKNAEDAVLGSELVVLLVPSDLNADSDIWYLLAIARVHGIETWIVQREYRDQPGPRQLCTFGVLCDQWFDSDVEALADLLAVAEQGLARDVVQ